MGFIGIGFSGSLIKVFLSFIGFSSFYLVSYVVPWDFIEFS